MTQLSYVAPIRVTSFFRTVSHNAAVGGVANSQHLLATAADLVPLGGQSLADLAAAAIASDLFGYVVNEGDHVHVQLYPGGVIPQWLFDQVAVA